MKNPEGLESFNSGATIRPAAARRSFPEDPPFQDTGGEHLDFQDRLRKGKIRLCDLCGGIMRRSSRMVLSALSGISLIALGFICMGLYGVGKHFLKPPWYIEYAMPGVYYLGALFIGVGIIFFFLREKIWICEKCREIRKR